jgi:hypothetical protein
MPFSSRRQSFGWSFTPVAAFRRSRRRRCALPLWGRAVGGITSLTLHLIAILAMPSIAALAQENSVETATQGAQPQPPNPPPHAGEGREGAPDPDNPRFAFHRIDGGFLRLDLLTGAVASCSQNAADWTCVPGRDERAALDQEMARLRRDNAILKNTLLEHGVPLPNDMKADLPGSPSAAGGGGKGSGAPAAAEAVPRPPQTVPPAAPAPPPSVRSGEPDRASRDDAEIKRITAVMEKVWRRLVETMMNIQRDLQKKDEPPIRSEKP